MISKNLHFSEIRSLLRPNLVSTHWYTMSPQMGFDLSHRQLTVMEQRGEEGGLCPTLRQCRLNMIAGARPPPRQ